MGAFELLSNIYHIMLFEEQAIHNIFFLKLKNVLIVRVGSMYIG